MLSAAKHLGPAGTLIVMLSAAKHLVRRWHGVFVREILRCAQNDKTLRSE